MIRNADWYLWQNTTSFSIQQDQGNMTVHIWNSPAWHRILSWRPTRKMRWLMYFTEIIPCLPIVWEPERLLKWQRQPWRASVWDYVKRVCLWFRTIWRSSGQVIFCGYIPEPISLLQQRKTLSLLTVRNSVPESPREIMMRLLSGIVSLRKFRFHRKDR